MKFLLLILILGNVLLASGWRLEVMRCRRLLASRDYEINRQVSARLTNAYLDGFMEGHYLKSLHSKP